MQGNLYTGKEVAELFIFKCASGGARMLLQYDQRYLHQTFFYKISRSFQQAIKKIIGTAQFLHTVNPTQKWQFLPVFCFS